MRATLEWQDQGRRARNSMPVIWPPSPLSIAVGPIVTMIGLWVVVWHPWAGLRVLPLNV